MGGDFGYLVVKCFFLILDDSDTWLSFYIYLRYSFFAKLREEKDLVNLSLAESAALRI